MRPFILTLLAAILLISCGKDKNEDPQPGITLVGTWTGVSQESKLTSGGKDFTEALIDEFGDAAWAAQMTDISIKAHDGANTMFFTELKIEDDGVLEASMGSSGAAPGKWSLTEDGKTVSMSLNPPSVKDMTGEVTKLTASELWIEVNLEVADNLLGMIPTYQYNSVLKYTRKK